MALEESEELEEAIPESTVLQSLPYLENDQNDAASQAPQASVTSSTLSFQVMEFSTKLHCRAC